MGVLQETIDSYNSQKIEQVPSEILANMARATAELKATGIEGRAVRSGDRMPDFQLPNQHGEPRRFSDGSSRPSIGVLAHNHMNKRGKWEGRT